MSTARTPIKNVAEDKSANGEKNTDPASSNPEKDPKTKVYTPSCSTSRQKVEELSRSSEASETTSEDESPTSEPTTPEFNLKGASGEQLLACMSAIRQRLQEMSFCPMPYPTFNGTGDAAAWLRSYKKAANFNKISTDDKLDRVGASLEGDASAWYHRTGWHATSWEEFEVEFKRRFIDEKAIRNRARKQLATMTKDPDMKYVHHLSHVLECCYEIDPEMSHENIIEKCLKTLSHEDIRSFAAAQP
ncbi:uncharacterized protein LOC108865063, partial [Galendromus occidentalis]|uniref:Uncharacterized protein LOC108865063 n=1 Tax=Galendromus occidentalis TaxID=34638 RepID=A0AAJ7L877_9ACAR